MSVSLEELEVGVQEVLCYTRFTGAFAASLREVVQRKLTACAAREKGLEVTDEELQKAADVFRVANNLVTAEQTENWLKGRGLDLDALENYLETNLLIYKFKDILAQEADQQKLLSLPAVQESLREIAYQEWWYQLGNSLDFNEEFKEIDRWF